EAIWKQRQDWVALEHPRASTWSCPRGLVAEDLRCGRLLRATWTDPTRSTPPRNISNIPAMWLWWGERWGGERSATRACRAGASCAESATRVCQELRLS